MSGRALLRCTQCVVVAGALFVMGGCVTLPAAAPTVGSVTPQRPAMTAFTLSGRFSAKDGKDQASGQFHYSQTESRRHLNIYSPLGTPMAEINADDTGATLMLANGSILQANSMVELLRNLVNLPATDELLSLWLQGRPSALALVNSATLERDSLGRITRFVESGWEVSVSDRFGIDDPNENVTDAPRRMRWSLMGTLDTDVRWFIDQFSVGRKTP